MKLRKGMKVKLHAFLNMARLEISRFSLHFGMWVAARRACERCCVLGLDTAPNYKLSMYTKLHGVTLQQTERLLQYTVCAELYILPAASRCGG